ncbi:MAG: flagellar hook-basal body complex protein [Terracidiphilus sp.]|jgi:flagellar hook protein FlgE
MASFYIPLTGLNADSTALNTIANDLSNMNTTAFKGQTTNFSDLFYQQVGSSGSGNEIQVGEGVRVACNKTDFAQGSYDTSGTTSSDVALDGSGFFVVSNGSSNLYTRAGDFTQDSAGNLITSDGMTVMGYPAVNGVVNTNAQLTAINIPLIGQVQQPEASTSFSMTANLDSASPIGTTFPAPMTLYDSLGVSYQATVNYTKTGTNTWSYSITLPDALTAAPASAATATTMGVTGSTPAATTVTIAAAAAAVTPAAFTANLTPASAVSGPDITYSYNFGTGGTVDSTTSLTINGTTLVIPGAGESIAALGGQINGLGIAGISANVTGNVLTITAPNAIATAMAAASTIVGDLTGTTSDFDFNTGGTVDAATNLLITGQTATGATATITAPTFTAGETVTQYAAALTSALSNAGITNVTVAHNLVTNQLSIVGANVSTTGSVSQDLAGTTTNYDFGSSATVDPALTNFTITGQTATGATATITAPAITAGETVAQYAAALTAALGSAGANIVGVTVSSSGGQLSITGANMTTTGSMSQDLSAATTSYRFGSSGGTSATVDAGTNLTITGLTTSSSTATITAPTVTAGESLATYAAALTTALSDAGIAGVMVSSTAGGQLSITGANISTSGSVIQDAMASANAIGTLIFNSSGNLVSPAADISGITITGLSDGAANLALTWKILGTSGTATISQEDSASALSAAPANGYATGVYQGFTIGSNGTVTASYSNGQTQAVGQLALANVTNLQGLALQGNGDYATTQASGAASIGASGTGGLGAIEDSSLEESNVNISAEFSDLIIAQRAFEANAKSITTFDTVTQDTINMVH